jgi:D-3-phosphoglycerate dehydrogenase / 2-oxoglutarate reductase
MQIGILEPNQFSEKAITSLEKLGTVKIFNEKDDLSKFLTDKHVIFVRLKYFLNKEMLNCATQLAYVCSPTTGHNHIDRDYLDLRGIKLISLKGEVSFLNTIRATPEHTFGLVLALLRNYKISFCDMQKNFKDRELLKGFEIYQKNIGIIGLGRVGRIISEYFTCFGAKVSFFDIKEVTHSTKINKANSLEELVNNNDVIILCASYSINNINMISENLLELMKGKYFVNTARGELVNEPALLKKVQSNHFQGLAIDVLSNENGCHNLNKLRKLSRLRNVIITPHIAGATYESMSRTEEFIASKLTLLLKSQIAIHKI